MSNDLPCDVDEIRTLFLFEKLSDEQLARLCRVGHVETVEAGWNTLVDLDLARARAALAAAPPQQRPQLYGDGHAGSRVVSALLEAFAA